MAKLACCSCWGTRSLQIFKNSFVQFKTWSKTLIFLPFFSKVTYVHVCGATENAELDIARPSKLLGLTSRDQSEALHIVNIGGTHTQCPNFQKLVSPV